MLNLSWGRAILPHLFIVSERTFDKMKIELKKNCCIKGQAFQVGDEVELEEGTDLNYLVTKGFAVKVESKEEKPAKAEKHQKGEAEK
jgi:hypothetical protein